MIIQAHEALNAFRAERLSDLNVQGCVLWLSDHFPDLTHAEMAGILDVTQQVVSRYVGIQSRQRSSARQRKERSLPDVCKVRSSTRHEAEVLASGGARYITEAHNQPKNDPDAFMPERLAA
ncbi:hypothetical protein ASF28_08750 [Methylobacterium sp. Leaf99]|nr:hypothetical protein ASF28_08750 [Methylobacterium sp. Leaf99]